MPDLSSFEYYETTAMRPRAVYSGKCGVANVLRYLAQVCGLVLVGLGLDTGMSLWSIESSIQK